MLDTAYSYGNEDGIKEGILNSNVPREEVIVLSKIGDDLFTSTVREKVLDHISKMGVGYLDILLMHFPGDDAQKRMVAWREMEQLVDEGVVKMLGIAVDINSKILLSSGRSSEFKVFERNFNDFEPI